jgi:hypothetical protein
MYLDVHRFAIHFGNVLGSKLKLWLNWLKVKAAKTWSKFPTLLNKGLKPGM